MVTLFFIVYLRDFHTRDFHSLVFNLGNGHDFYFIWKLTYLNWLHVSDKNSYLIRTVWAKSCSPTNRNVQSWKTALFASWKRKRKLKRKRKENENVRKSSGNVRNVWFWTFLNGKKSEQKLFRQSFTFRSVGSFAFFVVWGYRKILQGTICKIYKAL